jgi:acyl transferase domain-containing protein
VRFMESLRRLAGDAGRIFLEVGPRATSTTLARQVIKAEGRKAEGQTSARPAGAREALAVGSLKDDAAAESESVAQALGQLWLAGAGVDWEAFQSIGRRRLVSLPSYPFARDRHWLDPEVPGQAVMPLRVPAPSNGHPVPGPAVANGQPVAAVNGEGLPADVLEQTLMAQLTLMNEQLKLLSD